jgi:F-type H+-transporting ATPase subunit gamma
METRKLERFLHAQRRVVEGIDAAARDFHAHYPDLIAPDSKATPIYVLIGAERGFCGDFNEAILRALEGEPAAGSCSTLLITVGTRLSAALDGDPCLAERLTGASATEEVPAVLGRLVDSLNRLVAQRGPTQLTVLCWGAEAERVLSVPVLPPFRRDAAPEHPAHPYPPLLNLAPEAFLERLIEHYLFAALHEILFGSLMAEHQHRLRHLQGALQRVDDRVRELGLRRNMLRQEEITEEIELILLNLPAQVR